jgi:hypothetical protein
VIAAAIVALLTYFIFKFNRALPASVSDPGQIKSAL